jgi:hypothetical protein
MLGVEAGRFRLRVQVDTQPGYPLRMERRWRLFALSVGLVSPLGCGAKELPAADASVGYSDCPGSSAGDISPALLAGSVAACTTGYAHPNACCVAGPNKTTTCSESYANPFGPCANGALTFPDPQTCCSLADPCVCVAPDAAPSSTCSYPCGPGAYAPPLDGGVSPCTDVTAVSVDGGGTSPSVSCAYCCFMGACATSASTCGDQACGPTTWGCGACPDTFDHVQGIPDLCCRGDGGPSDECFSQAGQISDRPL